MQLDREVFLQGREALLQKRLLSVSLRVVRAALPLPPRANGSSELFGGAPREAASGWGQHLAPIAGPGWQMLTGVGVAVVPQPHLETGPGLPARIAPPLSPGPHPTARSAWLGAKPGRRPIRRRLALPGLGAASRGFKQGRSPSPGPSSSPSNSPISLCHGVNFSPGNLPPLPSPMKAIHQRSMEDPPTE